MMLLPPPAAATHIHLLFGHNGVADQAAEGGGAAHGEDVEAQVGAARGVAAGGGVEEPLAVPLQPRNLPILLLLLLLLLLLIF